ncbi:hypothetical protein M404DRAFT_668512 [Pisolithus tinctorius Marx 270]|uniref:Uncharacterized protein n=1 Tax=Pisolithus tinctorius Marx 270 TaxID=870435 RepID=A0A0C3J018_PISTI|nr:hypothetical protein M404DRAFT_668512 [Pisolithus tinctorius Marx 270]
MVRSLCGRCYIYHEPCRLSPFPTRISLCVRCGSVVSPSPGAHKQCAPVMLASLLQLLHSLRTRGNHVQYSKFALCQSRGVPCIDLDGVVIGCLGSSVIFLE